MNEAVVDLEDAVPADGKNQARRTLFDLLPGLETGTTRLLVRVNSPDSPWFVDDLAPACHATEHEAMIRRFAKDVLPIVRDWPESTVISRSLESGS